MSLRIEEISAKDLAVYARVPIAFTVETTFRVEVVEGGLGGIRLIEEPVETPYIKDYDGNEEECPTRWPDQFQVENWGFFLAKEADEPIGAAAVAWNTNDVAMLEERKDLSVLWDIRVSPSHRRKGVGKLIFQHAARWSRERGCKQMKIETQNINVPACRFYHSMGCKLGDIRRFGYANQAHVAHEVQLNWYLDL